MTSSLRTILGVGLLVVLAGAFWMLALSPKREEADRLGKQVDQLENAVASARQQAEVAAQARERFPRDYQQLVVLGKAVPSEADTPSLLVEVDRIAERTGVDFREIVLEASAEAAAPAPTAAVPTEASAAALPIGATVGSAGFAVMPYTLTFEGDFFAIARFLDGIDGLVKTKSNRLVADGRLLTIDGFSLIKDPETGSLDATLAATTYVTPAAGGAAAAPAADPAAPPADAAVPTATTTGP
jgi:Tfp pilus assembly protein PilO